MSKKLSLFLWISVFFASNLLANNQTAIIFDASHSMTEDTGPSGDQKLITAQVVSKELINRSSSSATKLPALVVFGSFNYSKKLQNCDNIEIVSTGGTRSTREAERLKRVIDGVDAKGRTPIFGALKKLAESTSTDRVNTAIVTDFINDNTCMAKIDCPALKSILGYQSASNSWRVRVKFLIVPGTNNTRRNIQLTTLSKCLNAEIVPIPNPDPDSMNDTIDRIFLQLNDFQSVVGTDLGSIIFESQIPAIPFMAADAKTETYLISVSNGSQISAKFSEHYKISLPSNDYTVDAKWINVGAGETSIKVIADETTRVSFKFPTASISFHVVDSDGLKLFDQFIWRVEKLDTNESLEITTPHLQTALPPGNFRLTASKNGRVTSAQDLKISGVEPQTGSLTFY